MSNSVICCLLEICCAPVQAREKLAAKLADDFGIPSDKAKRAADWLLDTFDFAPAGSLTQFKAAIAAQAREHP